MNKIKNLAKKYLPEKIQLRIREFLSSRKQTSYAQSGEDLLINFLMNHQRINKNNGFYVDVGALHPDIISNTKFFYKRGWRGINIDALPGSMNKFNKKRKRDKNIEAVISLESAECDFFIFKENAINTLSSELARKYQDDGYKLDKIIKIKTKKLQEILDKEVPEKVKIDLMSIDVEGFDLEVLKSNNWEKHRPVFILIEQSDFDLHNPDNSEIFKYLKNLNYNLVAKTSVNLLFQEKKQI